MYLPSLPGVGRAGQLAVRVQDPDAFATRLRKVAADADPTIRLTDVKPLGRAGGPRRRSPAAAPPAPACSCSSGSSS